MVRHKVTRQFPQTTTFEEKGEPKRNRTEVLLLQYQPNALPLGQSGLLRSFVGRLLGLHVYINPNGLLGMGKKGAVVGGWGLVWYLCNVHPKRSNLQKQERLEQ